MLRLEIVLPINDLQEMVRTPRQPTGSRIERRVNDERIPDSGDSIDSEDSHESDESGSGNAITVESNNRQVQ